MLKNSRRRKIFDFSDWFFEKIPRNFSVLLGKPKKKFLSFWKSAKKVIYFIYARKVVVSEQTNDPIYRKALSFVEQLFLFLILKFKNSLKII